MKYLVMLTAIFALLSAPLMAQTQAPAPGAPAAEAEEEEPVDVNAVVKTLTDLTNDQTKLAGFCAISKEMSGLKETDVAKAEELGKKMDTYLTGLGDEYVEALDAEEAVAPDSEDGKKLEAAFSALDAKCGA